VFGGVDGASWARVGVPNSSVNAAAINRFHRLFKAPVVTGWLENMPPIEPQGRSTITRCIRRESRLDNIVLRESITDTELQIGAGAKETLRYAIVTVRLPIHPPQTHGERQPVIHGEIHGWIQEQGIAWPIIMIPVVESVPGREGKHDGINRAISREPNHPRLEVIGRSCVFL